MPVVLPDWKTTVLDSDSPMPKRRRSSSSQGSDVKKEKTRGKGTHPTLADQKVEQPEIPSDVAIRDSEGPRSGLETPVQPRKPQRKPRQPIKVAEVDFVAEMPAGDSASTGVPVEKGGKKRKSAMVKLEKLPLDTMKQGFNHDFELEMNLGEPLHNLIRLIQPSVNCDLSKAAVFLCNMQELSPGTSLKNCVREGSEGLVKVKLVVTLVPGAVPAVNITDVLQATLETASSSSPRESPPPLPAINDREVVNNRHLPSKKRVPNPKKKTIADHTQEWLPSVSFQVLVENGVSEDPLKWTRVDVANWLAWASQNFTLPDLNVQVFSQLDGSVLCSLSRPLFSQLVGKDDRDLFWTHFDLLRSTHQAAVPRSRSVPIAPSDTSGRSSAKKTPIGMSSRGFAKESTGTMQLWQFLLELLVGGEHPDYLEWTGNDKEFRLLEPERVAELWGRCKSKANMNYEKMSRALRYYYDGKILAKVPGKHFTYKFVCEMDKLVSRSSADWRSSKPAPEEMEVSEPLDLSPHTSNPSSPMTPASRHSESDASVEVPYPPYQQRIGAAALDLRRLSGQLNLSQMAA